MIINVLYICITGIKTKKTKIWSTKMLFQNGQGLRPIPRPSAMPKPPLSIPVFLPRSRRIKTYHWSSNDELLTNMRPKTTSRCWAIMAVLMKVPRQMAARSLAGCLSLSKRTRARFRIYWFIPSTVSAAQVVQPLKLLPTCGRNIGWMYLPLLNQPIQ